MSSGRLTLILTALLLLCLTGCEGGTLLDGIITDIAGKPVTAATITLEVVGGQWHKALEQSNDQGAYQIVVWHYPERTQLIVTVSKDGFEPFMKKFLSKGNHQHLNVKLKPAVASDNQASAGSQN